MYTSCNGIAVNVGWPRVQTCWSIPIGLLLRPIIFIITHDPRINEIEHIHGSNYSSNISAQSFEFITLIEHSKMIGHLQPFAFANAVSFSLIYFKFEVL
jgi:hypothetical protein